MRVFLAFDPNDPEWSSVVVIRELSNDGQDYSDVKTNKRVSRIEFNIPKDFKYRFNWNAPIISSPHDRSVIYHAGNVVFKTLDEGINWEVISPDLTRNDKTHQGPGGGPFTNEAAGGENYNTLTYLTESPHEKGVLWAGSDDGLVHLRDGGINWANVTPKDLPEAIINTTRFRPMILQQHI